MVDLRYYINSDTNAFDAGARDALDGKRHPADLEKTQADLKELERQAQAELADIENSPLRTACGNWLVSRHPEYVDTDKNAKLLMRELKLMGAEGSTQLSDYETAFSRLLADDVIEVDADKLQAEEQRVAHNRVRDEHGRYVAENSLSEDEMYNLDLAEVKRRANLQMGRRS